MMVKIREDGLEKEDPYGDGLPNEIRRAPSHTIGDIARFEAGPRAGIFLHEILEYIDFTETAPHVWQAVIEDRMEVHGFDRCWQNTLYGMLERVVRTPSC